jgi:hypothetical protein
MVLTRTIRVLLILALAALTARAEIVDRIVAIAGNRVITWSDVVAEARYQAFLANEAPPSLGELARPGTMAPILTRLIDQRLLEQDRDMLPFAAPDGSEVDGRLEETRSRFPSPEAYRQALARAGLAEEALIARLTREVNLMAFVDRRLRPQVRLDTASVERYYSDTLTPELRRGGQTEMPPMEDVREQIEQVLSAQQMNERLEQLLRDLRVRMGVKILP